MTAVRPALLIATVYFDPAEHAEALRLGVHLYDALTRPITSPLAFGAGIPVRVAMPAAALRMDVADTLVVVPVLGKRTFLGRYRAEAQQRLAEWNQTLGNGHVLPVLLSENWQDSGSKIPNAISTEISGHADPRPRTFAEILLGLRRLLDDEGVGPRLFISHAKDDSARTHVAAQKISNYVRTDATNGAFFDVTDIKRGKSLSEQIDEVGGRGVFVVVRGDNYSASTWCQRELMTAKLAGLPTLTVEVLIGGEVRTYPYSGNSACVVWDGDPRNVVERAMIEWLRAKHFRLLGKRLLRDAGLPDETDILSRPPELLDLAQGPLNRATQMYVLHPDPELSVPERTVLRHVRPGMRLATPTTLYRRQLSNVTVPALRAPLTGQRVAMSLSDAVMEKTKGHIQCHVVDATVDLARALIGAGAAIGYGGDFRLTGYTRLLSELVRAYKQTADDDGAYLHSYLAATSSWDDVPADFQATVHALGESEHAMVPVPADTRVSPALRALCVSDMRRMMAKDCTARVLLGGQSHPAKNGSTAGYGGRYPGIVEEAWWTLRAATPLFVAGGFGGAAALVADLVEQMEIPLLLRDETFQGDEYSAFRERAAAIDANEFRLKLSLPESMTALAESLRAMLKERLSSDDASRNWNGLTVAENHELYRSDDPITITSLVMRGLLHLADSRAIGKLRIELVRDSITRAAALDAIAIATFENVKLDGAGAALDEATSGRVAAAVAARERLVALPSSAIDARWLVVTSLGTFALGERASLPDLVEKAAGDAAARSRRHGFARLGVITFAGGTHDDLPELAARMVKGLSAAAATTTVIWFEKDRGKFDVLRTVLSARDDVVLTVPVDDSRLVEELPRGDRDAMLFVRYDGEALQCTVLPPGGRAAAVATSPRLIAAADFAALSTTSDGRVPGVAELDGLGDRLAQALFDDATSYAMRECRDTRLVVVHDLGSSRLPFEALRVGGHRPSLGKGIVRRPSIENMVPQNVVSRPPAVERLRIALIVNPTKDLKTAEAEGREIREMIKDRAHLELVHDLWREQATKDKVLEALTDSDIDIFHYCGHAFFESPGSRGSGLLCAGQERLRLSDLKGKGFAARVAFFNACQSARVRGVESSEGSNSFAEYFLRAGVEAYIGGFWLVDDSASATFAKSVYQRLLLGDSLERAVLAARTELDRNGNPEWSNFVLYGDGNFVLRAVDKSLS